MNGGMIVYQQSIAGMMNTKTIDTLQIQSDSTFTLTLPVEDYERVNFILYGKAVLGSVISKGGKIQLDVDATAQEPLTIQGVDEKAVAVSRLLNRLNAAVWDLRARRGDRWQIAKDTVATSVAQKLKDDAVSLESQLTGLDEDLQEKARQDIRMQIRRCRFMPNVSCNYIRKLPGNRWCRKQWKRTGRLTTPGFRKIFISRMSHKRKLSRILSHRIKGKLSLWTFGQRGVVLAVIPLLL